MARTALIRTVSGLVENVIELEPGADWQPPIGYHAQDAEDVGPGDSWNGAKYVKRVHLRPAPALPDPDLADFDAGTPVEKMAILRRRVLRG